MKKIIILILFIFFLSGCKAEYSLVYEDNILKESLNVVLEKNSEFSNEFSDSINQYYGMPLLVNYKLQAGDLDENECDNCVFYNKKLIDENNIYGINFNYDYLKKNDIVDSSIIYVLFDKVYINDYYFKADETKNIFDYYNYLDNITISFSTDKNISETNCDEFKDGKYFWYINKYNYVNRNIYVKFDNDGGFITDDGYMSWEFVKYILMGLSVVILICIVVIYEKVKKSNQ